MTNDKFQIGSKFQFQMTKTILSEIWVIPIYLESGARNLALISLGRGLYENRRPGFFESMVDASSFPVLGDD